jgi:hypothetical protein
MNPDLRNRAIWRRAFSDILPLAREAIKEAIDLEDPPAFIDFVVDLFDHTEAKGLPPRWPGSNLVVRALSTPALCPLPEALRLARAAVRLDNRLDSKILRHLTTPARRWPESATDADILHVLEVIDAVSDCERLVFFLMKFVKSPNPRLKSKAVKLIARACRNPGWAKVILSDPDHRTRANLMEGLGLQTGAHVKSLLTEGAKDSAPRVALNALLALSRSGDTLSYQRICELAGDSRPEFQRAAEWALRQIDAATNPSTSVPHQTA